LRLIAHRADRSWRPQKPRSAQSRPRSGSVPRLRFSRASESSSG